MAGRAQENGDIAEAIGYVGFGTGYAVMNAVMLGQAGVADHVSVDDSIDGKIDNRGFTGHEMLDQLDLVHMNGRVYDPLLGKFMSADPVIQDPMNGQNYNRYSYVLNNPTNLTDPTGFRFEGYVTGSNIYKKDASFIDGMVATGNLSFSDANAIKDGINSGAGSPALANAGTRSEGESKGSANTGTTNWTGGQTREMTASQVVGAVIDGLKGDPTVQTITSVIVTASKLISDSNDIVSGNSHASELAKDDLANNWVKYGASLMILGNLRSAGNMLGTRPTGSYTNTHASGKTYHGKGDKARSQASGREKSFQYNDEHIATDWTPAPNRIQAFKDEALRLRRDDNGGPRGHDNPNNYNQRASPGEKYLQFLGL